MATGMDDEERDSALAVASSEAAYDYRNRDNDDDHVSAELWRMPDGRAFRLITMSGFDSPYGGAMNVAEWLDAGEEAGWSDFGQGDGPDIHSVAS